MRVGNVSDRCPYARLDSRCAHIAGLPHSESTPSRNCNTDLLFDSRGFSGQGRFRMGRSLRTSQLIARIVGFSRTGFTCTRRSPSGTRAEHLLALPRARRPALHPEALPGIWRAKASTDSPSRNRFRNLRKSFDRLLLPRGPLVSAERFGLTRLPEPSLLL